MAAATMAANVVSVAITLVFTRLLGADGYGSLAALLNLSLILFVPGSALQVAVARQGALGRLGRGPQEAALLARWTRRLLVAIAVAVLVAVLAREPLARLLNLDEAWAAAAIPLSAGLWLVVSLQRGVLQGARAYLPVGLSIVLEAAGRLITGAGLATAGLDVTGAYLGTPIALALTAAVLAVVVRRRLARTDATPAPAPHATSLADLARLTLVPIAALTLVAALQNVDVLIARHVLPEGTAGVYAAATVAAKALVWIAVGLGLWLLPEAVARAAAGGDARPVLARALAVIAAVALPAMVLYAAVPGTVLRVAFGAEFVAGAGILLPLGGAYALLAVTYLAVQFLLGLHTRRFLPLLAAAALAEPVLLAFAGDLRGFAFTVLGVQGAVSLAVLALALRARPR
jgi:O-antigen/teichoic acid export membrane protein